MHLQTRKLYDAFTAHIAELNGVSNAATKFSVAPQVEQRMEERIRESSDFLKKINVYGVDQTEGEKIGIDANSTIASRTDTSNTGERNTQDPTALSAGRYRCKQTNFDTHLSYAKLDAWRHDKNFQNIITSTVNSQIARDRLMIGFNGTSAAATTNRVTNPLLQDVNIGWLQSQRTAKPASVMSNKKIGNISGNDYKNLDAAVIDAANNLIAAHHAGNPELIVICGRKLLNDKFMALVEDNDKPTERNALDIIITNKLIGGLPVATVPFFPADAFAITTLSNLSIYFQRETTRRAIIDNPKRDRIEEYRSVNECYVVEDHDLMCLVEDILEPNSAGDGWE